MASAHDDHTCFPCEQRLRQSGPPGFPWRPPLLPVCDSWRHLCSTQRCGLRDAHDLHLCMRCERRPATDPVSAGGGDPWGGERRGKGMNSRLAAGCWLELFDAGISTAV